MISVYISRALNSKKECWHNKFWLTFACSPTYQLEVESLVVHVARGVQGGQPHRLFIQPSPLKDSASSLPFTLYYPLSIIRLFQVFANLLKMGNTPCRPNYDLGRREWGHQDHGSGRRFPERWPKPFRRTTIHELPLGGPFGTSHVRHRLIDISRPVYPQTFPPPGWPAYGLDGRCLDPMPQGGPMPRNPRDRPYQDVYPPMNRYPQDGQMSAGYPGQLPVPPAYREGRNAASQQRRPYEQRPPPENYHDSEHGGSHPSESSRKSQSSASAGGRRFGGRPASNVGSGSHRSHVSGRSRGSHLHGPPLAFDLGDGGRGGGRKRGGGVGRGGARHGEALFGEGLNPLPKQLFDGGRGVGRGGRGRGRGGGRRNRGGN